MCNRATQNSFFVPVLDIQYMPLFVGSLCMSWIPIYFKMSTIIEWWSGSYEEGSEGAVVWSRVYLGCMYM